MTEKPSTKPQSATHAIVVRSYRPDDQPMVSQLYTEGLLAGQIAPNDTGADIENMAEAYFNSPTSHFWIAENDGQVLGMIGVAGEENQTAEIRRLRVRKDHQNSATASKLVETAVAHCKKHGYLKVILDTRFEKEAAMDLFDRFGFQHNRTKNLHGKDLFEFYLDLYRQTKDEQEDKA